MVNGDLLRQLFRSHAKRDDTTFRAAAEAIIQEERAKNHRLLADDLERILMNGSATQSERRLFGELPEIPKDKDRGFPLVDIAQFSYDWNRLVAPPRTITPLQQIAEEHRRADVLAAGGLRPKQRVLFYGPPGCGKTLAAQVLAGVLGYNLVTVRFDAVVSSLLGETAANLRRVFEFVQRGNWVVLFDEFDAIGKDRDNPFEHGELKRLVNTLLQLMDSLRGTSLLIAATNHEGLLDNAVWRRFEAVVPFNVPSVQDRVLLLRLFLKGFDCAQLNIESVARRMAEATGSDIELLAIEAARRTVLAGRIAILNDDVDPVLESLRQRFRVIRQLSAPDDRNSTKRKKRS
jgi:energy-coupling factor transporter ATP-binding protein EcfA2